MLNPSAFSKVDFVGNCDASHSIFFQCRIFLANSVHLSDFETLQNCRYNIKQSKVEMAVEKHLAITYLNCATTLSRYILYAIIRTFAKLGNEIFLKDF